MPNQLNKDIKLAQGCVFIFKIKTLFWFKIFLRWITTYYYLRLLPVLLS